jgi:hypothetical protein
MTLKIEVETPYKGDILTKCHLQKCLKANNSQGALRLIAEMLYDPVKVSATVKND